MYKYSIVISTLEFFCFRYARILCVYVCERWILQNWWLLFILSEHFSWRNLLEDRFCFHEQHVSGLNLLLWTVPIVLWHLSNLFHVCMHKGGSEELEKAITTDSFMFYADWNPSLYSFLLHSSSRIRFVVMEVSLRNIYDLFIYM